MTQSPFAAAHYLGHLSSWSLSSLTIQKLLFVAQMCQLGRDGKRLITGCFHATDYGPLHPELHNKLKIFGADPVKDIFNGERLQDEDARTLVRMTYDKLCSCTPGQLVAITHAAGGAWERNYLPRASGVPIPDSHMIAEYESRMEKARLSEAPSP